MPVANERITFTWSHRKFLGTFFFMLFSVEMYLLVHLAQTGYTMRRVVPHIRDAADTALEALNKAVIEVYRALLAFFYNAPKLIALAIDAVLYWSVEVINVFFRYEQLLIQTVIEYFIRFHVGRYVCLFNKAVEYFFALINLTIEGINAAVRKVVDPIPGVSSPQFDTLSSPGGISINAILRALPQVPNMFDEIDHVDVDSEIEADFPFLQRLEAHEGLINSAFFSMRAMTRAWWNLVYDGAWFLLWGAIILIIAAFCWSAVTSFDVHRETRIEVRKVKGRHRRAFAAAVAATKERPLPETPAEYIASPTFSAGIVLIGVLIGASLVGFALTHTARRYGPAVVERTDQFINETMDDSRALARSIVVYTNRTLVLGLRQISRNTKAELLEFASRITSIVSAVSSAASNVIAGQISLKGLSALNSIIACFIPGWTGFNPNVEDLYAFYGDSYVGTVLSAIDGDGENEGLYSPMRRFVRPPVAAALRSIDDVYSWAFRTAIIIAIHLLLPLIPLFLSDVLRRKRPEDEDDAEFDAELLSRRGTVATRRDPDELRDDLDDAEVADASGAYWQAPPPPADKAPSKSPSKSPSPRPPAKTPPPPLATRPPRHTVAGDRPPVLAERPRKKKEKKKHRSPRAGAAAAGSPAIVVDASPDTGREPPPLAARPAGRGGELEPGLLRASYPDLSDADSDASDAAGGASAADDVVPRWEAINASHVRAEQDMAAGDDAGLALYERSAILARAEGAEDAADAGGGGKRKKKHRRSKSETPQL